MNIFALFATPKANPPHGAFLNEQVCTLGFAGLPPVTRVFLGIA